MTGDVSPLSVELDAAPITLTAAQAGTINLSAIYMPQDPADTQVEIQLGMVTLAQYASAVIPFDPSSTIFGGAYEVILVAYHVAPDGSLLGAEQLIRVLNYRSTDLNIDQRLNNWDVSIAIDRVMNGQMTVRRAVEVIEDVLSNGTP